MHFLLRRLLGSGIVLLAVSFLAFTLLALAPGDFLSDMRVDPAISGQTVRQLAHQYGLDRPLLTRYAQWLGSVVRGDLGFSFAYDMPVSRLLAPRARNTLVLTLTATLITWVLAIIVGVTTAEWRQSVLDRSIGLTTSTALAVPDIIVATALLAVAVRTRVLPVGGMTSFDFENRTLFGKGIDIVQHALLPVIAMVIILFPVLVRHVRGSVASVLAAGYITAGRARGLPPRAILYRHALRAAAGPLISLAGLSAGSLLSASLIVEVVMGWPGLGPLLVEAILARDTFVVIGAVMASTLLLLLANALADIALYALDPRIRRA